MWQLALEVRSQEMMFEFFENIFKTLVAEHRANGTVSI